MEVENRGKRSKQDSFFCILEAVFSRVVLVVAIKVFRLNVVLE